MTPPDLTRCQALVPGNGPFTMGGKIGDPRNGYRNRCENKPTVIATECKPGPDGLIGSMSLCESCKTVMVKQLGRDFARFQPIQQDQPRSSPEDGDLETEDEVKKHD